MVGTAFFFATLAALVAAKCAARIAINSSDFDGLPLPTQIDWPRSLERNNPIAANTALKLFARCPEGEGGVSGPEKIKLR